MLVAVNWICDSDASRLDRVGKAVVASAVFSFILDRGRYNGYMRVLEKFLKLLGLVSI